VSERVRVHIHLTQRVLIKVGSPRQLWVDGHHVVTYGMFLDRDGFTAILDFVDAVALQLIGVATPL
jgi:hypothetical protein